MYQGFVSAAQEQLPWAKIVVDRFHVAKAYRKCADTVGQREVKRLKQELSKEEYELVLGAMWPLRKSPVELNDDHWELRVAAIHLLAQARTSIYPPRGINGDI